MKQPLLPAEDPELDLCTTRFLGSLLYLHNPGRQWDITAAITYIASSSVEAHDRLHFQSVLPGLFEELYVGLEVILLGPMPLTDAPPALHQTIIILVSCVAVQLEGSNVIVSLDN